MTFGQQIGLYSSLSNLVYSATVRRNGGAIETIAGALGVVFNRKALAGEVLSNASPDSAESERSELFVMMQV